MSVACTLHTHYKHIAHTFRAPYGDSNRSYDKTLHSRGACALYYVACMLHNCCRDSNRGDDEMLRLIRDGLRTGVRDRRECETHSLLPVEACIADLLEQLDGYIDLLCQAATYARHALDMR